MQKSKLIFVVMVLFTVIVCFYFLFFLPSKPVSATGLNSVVYTYDSLGRLIGATNPNGTSSAYSYDPAENRVLSTEN
ncbi:MAG: RHS repeat domain-containing protein [Advenella sp.]|nr:RHS repeat domain-containing protein [Advenella sp.]